MVRAHPWGPPARPGPPRRGARLGGIDTPGEGKLGGTDQRQPSTSPRYRGRVEILTLSGMGAILSWPYLLAFGYFPRLPAHVRGTTLASSPMVGGTTKTELYTRRAVNSIDFPQTRVHNPTGTGLATPRARFGVAESQRPRGYCASREHSSEGTRWGPYWSMM
jgi:hypothetical protein